MTDHTVIELGNGVRLVHKKVNNTKIVHCGILFDIGSRDEPESLQGIAHFWEHMAFKGARNRNSYHIINSLESVGGELNAFTTKEKICFHASVLNEHFERAVRLITDISFYSTFPAKEIEKERKVILDEMLMYEDLPEESLQDDFDQVFFPDQAIGRNILGTKDSVRKIRRHHFPEFIKKNLNHRRAIVSVVGNISSENCEKIVRKYITDLPRLSGNHKRKPPVPARGIKTVRKKNISRAYCAIGFPAYALGNHKRMKLFMLSNILGGPSMNSRLNMELRERRGLVYSADASYVAYSDIGILSLYFGTETNNLNQSLDLIKKEIRKLREVPLGKIQLHQAKEQLVGQLAMSEENNVSLMIMLGRSILDLNRIDLLEDIIKEIRSVTSLDLRNIANEIFRESKTCRLIFEPE